MYLQNGVSRKRKTAWENRLSSLEWHYLLHVSPLKQQMKKSTYYYIFYVNYPASRLYIRLRRPIMIVSRIVIIAYD